MKFHDPELSSWWGKAEAYSLLTNPEEDDTRLYQLGVSKRLIKELRWLHKKNLLKARWEGKQVNTNPDESGWDF